MSDRAMINRSGPFWEFLAGRQPAPPAAMTLGWELSWVAPERARSRSSSMPARTSPIRWATCRAGFWPPCSTTRSAPRSLPTLGGGEFAATVKLKVTFLRLATPGRITGTGRVVHRGESIAFLAGELRDETAAGPRTHTTREPGAAERSPAAPPRRRPLGRHLLQGGGDEHPDPLIGRQDYARPLPGDPSPGEAAAPASSGSPMSQVPPAVNLSRGTR